MKNGLKNLSCEDQILMCYIEALDEEEVAFLKKKRAEKTKVQLDVLAEEKKELAGFLNEKSKLIVNEEEQQLPILAKPDVPDIAKKALNLNKKKDAVIKFVQVVKSDNTKTDDKKVEDEKKRKTTEQTTAKKPAESPVKKLKLVDYEDD